MRRALMAGVVFLAACETIEQPPDNSAGATSAHALSAPAAGVDCECAATGAYVLPAAPVAIAPADPLTNLSPGGRYVVTATNPGGAPHVSVASVAQPGTPILSDLAGTSWGFSPDDDRFVVFHSESGLPVATLYNLTGPHPATPVFTSASFATGGTLAFSPHGRYALSMWLGPDPFHFQLDVRDAETGQRVYQTAFTFAPPPADALPPGATQLTAVVVGFGPDPADRSLVFVYVDGYNAPLIRWSLVNLGSSPASEWGTSTGYGFAWGFSPCGDVLSYVSSNTSTAYKEAYLYATRDRAQLGYAQYPITDTESIRATATSHVVHHNATDQVLAPNTANAICSGSSSEVFPRAAFSAPGSTLAGLPVSFTDQSTTSEGQITSYAWSFGDGGVAHEANPQHTFAHQGTYSVQLTVTNTQGRADTVTHDIVVMPNQPPVPAFQFAPIHPRRRDVVTLTDTSTDDDGIARVSWAIDGSIVEGPVVQFRACAPNVSVTITVRDGAGQEASLTQVIEVTAEPELPVPAGSDLALAAAAACPGDTLVLEAGHYAGGVTLDGVSLRGAGRGKTWIEGYGDAASSWGWALRLWSPGGGYDSPAVSVSGLTVSGGGLSPAEGGGIAIFRGNAILSDVEATANTGPGVFCYNHGDIDVHDSYLHHNQGTGIILSLCSESSVQRTELAFNLGGGAGVFESARIVFAFNDVHDNGSAEDGAGLLMNDMWISQVYANRFHGNATTSPEGATVAVSGWQIAIAGNLVVGNQAGGIGDEEGAEIANCTIADNRGVGLRANSTSLFNTIIHGNGDDLVGVLAQDDSNLIGVDPMFARAGDYHLASGSPAIDQGDTAQVPEWLTLDGDADPRILASTPGGGARVDIGWDEWRIGSAPEDTTPPVSTANVDPAPNADGWNRETTTVTIQAADDLSGVKEIVYSLSGAGTGGATVDGGEAHVPITTEGTTTVTFFARDQAGNEEAAHTVQVRIDRTGPVFACSAGPGTLSPPNHRMVPVHVTVQLADGLSGPVSYALSSVISNEPDNGSDDGNTTDDIQQWSIGTADVDGLLRAERSGTGSGRTYTLVYTAQDVAGNTSTCSTTVTVPR